MDLLESGLFDAPYNYTFNFWTDYLGLSTIVQEKRSELHPPAASLLVNNSITESLKATLGLEDDHHHHHHHLHHLHQHHQHQHQHHHDSSSPGCPCVMGHGGDLGTHGGDSSCSCCCSCSCSSSGGAPRSPAPPHPPPPPSIFDLKARLSLLRPPRDGDTPAPAPAERDTAAYREAALFGGAVATDLQGRGALAAAAAAASERRRRSGKAEPGKVCVFCRNNGAPEEVFASHVLKAADGRVLCPVLRAYTCPLCGANGDHAHTIKYCPLSRDQQPSHRAAKGPRTVHKSLAIF